MGLIRGALITLVTILLFGSLVFTGACLTFSSSLSYEVLKPEMHSVVYDLVMEDNNLTKTIDKDLMQMKVTCNVNDSYAQEILDTPIEIPCDVVNQGSEAVFNYAIDGLVEKNYYKEYNCVFWHCFNQENPFFIFSKQSQDYWNSGFYLGLVISILLILATFFLTEKRMNYPFFLGGILIIISFLFLGAGKLVPMLLGWEFFSIIGVLFSQAYFVFLIFIIIGVVLIFLGIVLKFLSLGRFIDTVFKKEITTEDVKREVREEISKEKSERAKSKKSKK